MPTKNPTSTVTLLFFKQALARFLKKTKNGAMKEIIIAARKRDLLIDIDSQGPNKVMGSGWKRRAKSRFTIINYCKVMSGNKGTAG